MTSTYRAKIRFELPDPIRLASKFTPSGVTLKRATDPATEVALDFLLNEAGTAIADVDVAVSVTGTSLEWARTSDSAPLSLLAVKGVPAVSMTDVAALAVAEFLQAGACTSSLFQVRNKFGRDPKSRVRSAEFWGPADAQPVDVLNDVPCVTVGYAEPWLKAPVPHTEAAHVTTLKLMTTDKPYWHLWGFATRAIRAGASGGDVNIGSAVIMLETVVEVALAATQKGWTTDTHYNAKKHLENARSHPWRDALGVLHLTRNRVAHHGDRKLAELDPDNTKAWAARYDHGKGNQSGTLDLAAALNLSDAVRDSLRDLEANPKLVPP